MSLVRSAVRISAVAALRAGCWPVVKVRDSDNRPLDIAASTATQPYVVVYTDSDNASEENDDRRSLDLIIEFGLARPIPLDAQHGPTVTIPVDTDANFELMVDALDRQVTNALANPHNKWAVILHGLCAGTLRDRTSNRGGSAEKARWAARQIVFTVKPIDEPIIGSEMPEVMQDFIDAAKADEMLATAGAFIEAAMAGDVVTAWREAQAMFWMTERAASGIGLGPVIITDDEPLYDEITAAQQDSIDQVIADDYMKRGH